MPVLTSFERAVLALNDFIGLSPESPLPKFVSKQDLLSILKSALKSGKVDPFLIDSFLNEMGPIGALLKFQSGEKGALLANFIKSANDEKIVVDKLEKSSGETEPTKYN